jgi:hypothetical protein
MLGMQPWKLHEEAHGWGVSGRSFPACFGYPGGRFHTGLCLSLSLSVINRGVDRRPFPAGYRDTMTVNHQRTATI